MHSKDAMRSATRNLSAFFGSLSYCFVHPDWLDFKTIKPMKLPEMDYTDPCAGFRIDAENIHGYFHTALWEESPEDLSEEDLENIFNDISRRK